MINLACCYEFQQRYSLAIIWFNYALQIKNSLEEAHYGLSLCHIKIGNPQFGLDSIQSAMKLVGDEDKLKNEKGHYTYIRALAYKLLGK